MPTPTFETAVEIMAETSSALLCSFDGEEHWVPKSLMDEDGDINKSSGVGATGDVIIPEWFAVQEGIV